MTTEPNKQGGDPPHSASVWLRETTAQQGDAGEANKFALLGSKTKSDMGEVIHWVLASVSGRGLAEVEQGILTVMRSDEFLGSKWTVSELRYFLYETPYEKNGTGAQSHNALTNLVLEGLIRHGLASLQNRGLANHHPAPRCEWLHVSSEIRWSLGEGERMQVPHQLH